MTTSLLRSRAFADRVAAGELAPGPDAMLTSIVALGQERSVSFEIGVVRLMIGRLMAVEGLHGDAGKVSKAMGALTSALVDATRLQKLLVDEGAEGSSEALASLLAELRE